ncbi:nucleotidyl transferase AbiEii/AbiGii toxin family protein [Candidatus Parcubacteria bacterium]|nr:nucleotidyl transferase AbiEii/AbiGii toxin family protein [Candidatus Parcubacteria bacterium]
MNNQMIIILQKELEEVFTTYGEICPDIKRNVIREALQYFVLNFICHHPIYNNWIMYGGSVLRICHDLDRMSVDLDFEVDCEVTSNLLDELKENIIKHFKDTYNIDSDLLTIGTTNNRGLTLKFHIGDELNLGFHSNQVHIKIDLNYFVTHPKIVTESWPQNKYQLSFIIKTYNMSALMASKIAAVFLRGQRGVGNVLYEEKGRDIYDLLWYMSKKIVPDLDYLAAKNVKFADPKELFDKITIKILNNDKTDANLKQDLTPLFVNQIYIQNWLSNWRETYMRSLDQYEIYTVINLEEVEVHQNFGDNILSFRYWYKTEEDEQVDITYRLSDYWIHFREGDLSIEPSEKIKKLYSESNVRNKNNNSALKNKRMQYAEIFYQKTENYLKKTNHIMLGDSITTKLIRMTADNLNQKEQILLNKPALLSCELDDLLK